MRKKSNGKRRRQGKHTEYKRDLAGNLIEVVDALGNVDSYSDDSEGRILCKADTGREIRLPILMITEER